MSLKRWLKRGLAALLAIALVFSLVYPSLAAGASADFQADRSSPDSTGTSRQAAEWTFMVYLDADNNLEDAGIDDFLEMSTAGSTTEVNIVVQFDRIPGYDTSYGNWTDARRFLITPGMTPAAGNEVEILGEVNMADPATLVSFVEWGIANYPANHYAVVLWDHGGGWKADGTLDRDVCWDDSSAGDALTSPELKLAFATIYGDTGVILDIVGFDACLMGMLEVGYQIRDYADIMVAAEETEPWDGWPYDPILLALTANPAMTPSALATQIVNDYVASYSPFSYPEVTLSAVTLSIDTVATEASDLASAMISAGVTSEVAAARAVVEYFADPTYIDLYHFAELMQTSSDPAVTAAALDLMSAITANMIAEAHNPGYPNANGLSIYFPSTYGWYSPSYETDLDFTADTQWDEFLLWYYGILVPTTVSVSTDQFTYSPGDTMYVTIDASNATGDSVTFKWFAGIPQTGVWIPWLTTTLPAGFDNTVTFPISVGDWGATPFGIVWYVALVDPVTGEVLAGDAAFCAYSPGP